MISIGRAESNDIRLVDPKCSREHCVVERLPGGGHRLRDCGSRNGTRLNDVRTAQARLDPGDEIRIGEILIRYERIERTAVVNDNPHAAPPRRTERRADRRHSAPRLGLVAMVMILLTVGGFAIVRSGALPGGSSESPTTALVADDTATRGSILDGVAPGTSHEPNRLAGSDSTPPSLSGDADPSAHDADVESRSPSEIDAIGSRESRRNLAKSDDSDPPPESETRPRLASFPESRQRPADARPDPPSSGARVPQDHLASDATRLADHDPQQTTGATDEPLSDDALYFLLQDVEDHAEAHDYEAALATLDEGIARADEAQRPDLRNRRLDLVARRRVFEGIGRALASEGRAPVRIHAGLVARATPDGLEMNDGSTISWKSLRPSQYLRLAKQLSLSQGERVALAAFCFDYESLYDDAHRVLEELVVDDESAKPHIDELLSRKLGVAVPTGGFRIWNHRWMTPLRYEQLVRESRFDEYRSAVIGGSIEERIVAYNALRELGAPGVAALRELLPRCRDDIHMELRSTSTFAALTELREQRVELEALRRRVLDLVYDYESYPEVYKRPEASKEAAEAYAKTQREIDKAVARLEAVWQGGERRVVRFPTSFRQRLGELRTCLRWFDELAMSPEPLDSADFLEAFPDTWASVNLQTFPLDVSDAVRHENDLEVLAANVADASIADRDEIEMLAVCNEYRMLLGRRALRLDPDLTRSARGHSREMSTLGYFAHESPNAMNATPSDRALRAGFDGSHIGENIARGRVSARATHGLWTISPPHHRNLLSDDWTHLGTGRSGEYWTANYGRR